MLTTAIWDVDWLAVGLATLACYVLGALWFTPLFGRTWDSAIGVERRPGHRFATSYYVVPLVSAFLVSTTTAVLLEALGTEGLGDAVALGLVLGVGVAAPVTLTNALTPHTPRPFLFAAVTGSYHVVAVVLAAAVLLGAS
jgi:hypothetical protein